jgi:hypothetical protein
MFAARKSAGLKAHSGDGLCFLGQTKKGNIHSFCPIVGSDVYAVGWLSFAIPFIISNLRKFEPRVA